MLWKMRVTDNNVIASETEQSVLVIDGGILGIQAYIVGKLQNSPKTLPQNKGGGNSLSLLRA